MAYFKSVVMLVLAMVACLLKTSMALQLIGSVTLNEDCGVTWYTYEIEGWSCGCRGCSVGEICDFDRCTCWHRAYNRTHKLRQAGSDGSKCNVIKYKGV